MMNKMMGKGMKSGMPMEGEKKMGMRGMSMKDATLEVFPGMLTGEQETGMPDVGVLPKSARMTGDEMVGIMDHGYLMKKGTPSGMQAEFNMLPPGMNIEDQDCADIRKQKMMDYKGGCSYPGDGWE